MDEVPLADGLLAQRQNVKVVILANRRIEIELALDVRLVHHGVIVFVADLLVYQIVPLVLLRVRADITRVLLANAREIQDLLLLFLCLRVAAHLTSAHLARLVARREAARSEVLRVKDSHLRLVAQYEQQALRQEEALVDGLRFVADVKAVKLDLGLLQVLVHLTLIEVNAELDRFAPSYGNDGVALVPERRCQCVTPIEVWHGAWLDVGGTADGDEREGPRADLRDVHLLE